MAAVNNFYAEELTAKTTQSGTFTNDGTINQFSDLSIVKSNIPNPDKSDFAIEFTAGVRIIE